MVRPPKTCRSCGTPTVSEIQKFCENCGAPIPSIVDLNTEQELELASYKSRFHISHHSIPTEAVVTLLYMLGVAVEVRLLVWTTPLLSANITDVSLRLNVMGGMAAEVILGLVMLMGLVVVGELLGNRRKVY